MELSLEISKQTLPATRSELLSCLPHDAVCAELGVFRGDFSAEIIERCHPSALYLVDTFGGMVCSGDRNGDAVCRIDMGKEMANVCARFKSEPAVRVVQAKSWVWLDSVPPGTLDWVYLDTSHDFYCTSVELELMHRAVKRGGFLCGHDYSPEFPGVIRAVDAFRFSNRLSVTIFAGDHLPSFCIQK